MCTRITLEDVFGEDLHLARVRSLSNGVSGMLNARTASIAAIGRAYAYSRRFTIEETFRDTKDMTFGMCCAPLTFAMRNAEIACCF